MQTHDIDTVLDVGANSGQYARKIRRSGFRGRIISFEPVSSAFEKLERSSGRDPHWDAHRLALGARSEKTTINVSGNSGLSSSILPMLPAHRRIAPHSAYVAQEEVQMERLDTILDRMTGGSRRVMLKMDVQGYESQVLAGASGVLDSIRVLEMEVLFLPLYKGDVTFVDAVRMVQRLGFGLADLQAVQRGGAGQILWGDALFVRPPRRGRNRV